MSNEIINSNPAQLVPPSWLRKNHFETRNWMEFDFFEHTKASVYQMVVVNVVESFILQFHSTTIIGTFL